MESFSEATRRWFSDAFREPTSVQRQGWAAIAGGRHALLVAPTGSGKTLAAFLWSIDRLSRLEADAPPGVRVLYISPLKALVYDVERNLRAPLAGIRRTRERLELPGREVRVDVRTGDTSQRERQRQRRDPAEILVTTPESLFLLLGSQARENFATVHTIIVDEVHAVAGTKRGAHLALSLERLAELTESDPQRIGLSATVRPHDEIARFLCGDRPCEVVDVARPPSLDLEVCVPVPDMQQVTPPERPEERSGSILGELYSREVGTPPAERGIWAALYPELLETIRESRSTLIFVNSRGLCERLCQRLNELAEEELVRAHHGSVSHAQRAEIEDALKRGTLRGIVATSSLELGIDMGAVDRVILVESPGSVARGLQRAGRAGHGVGETSVARIYPKYRGDLLESAVVAAHMLRGDIEAIRVPRNPLDVLAQQIVAMCCDRKRSPEEIGAVVRRTHAYRELSDAALGAVLDMLAGRYPSTDFADLRPLLSWDRSKDELGPRRGAAMVSRLNAGTIPDRGTFGVHLGEEGPRVGELDEEMVFETRDGDTILLGASTWRVEQITRDRVIVSPAPGEPGRLPFWRGEGPGRPIELGQALGAAVRELGSLPREQMVQHLREHMPLGDFAADNLAAYLDEQREHTGTLPTDRSITVERFRDELGDWRVCILTPFGARVHAPWAMALQRILTRRSGYEMQTMYTDDGIVLRLDDVDEPPDADVLIPDPDELEELVTEQLGNTSLFAGLFRENAVRSLLMTRRGRQRNPLWAQRIKAQNLLAAVRSYPSFPVVLETMRHALSDVFDLPGLRDLLARIRSRQIVVHDVETRSASPFARSLVFAYVASYLYEGDQPLAERKAQALTLDRQLLTELLGQAELRELIDPLVLEELEEELAGLAEERRARDADELHDLLRRLGDLRPDELAPRCVDGAEVERWTGELERQRRAVAVTVAGERRWIAADDAGLYRDALGVMPPPGLPEDCLAAPERPLQQLLRRYAHCHGPFLARQAAQRYGLTAGQVQPALAALEAEGLLVHGEIRPGGAEPDWCDAEVLRRLKRRTLARLRNAVAPVEARLLGLFLPRWHGIGGPDTGPDRLLEAIAQLEGLALPWSSLSQVILPARVPRLTAQMLDMACASGAVIWVGHGGLGSRDGRVALYLREHAAALLPPADEADEADGPVHAAIIDTLRQRGASFVNELEHAARAAEPGLTAQGFKDALWDMVWRGRITNDTFAPLRSLGGAAKKRGRARAHALAGGRWSLVPAAEVSATERAVARTNMLLERYGVVSREAAQAEDLPGGFAAVYRVLRSMEEGGRARRGYFVEGLTGAQFGNVGAVDRLRAEREDDGVDRYTEDDVRVLAAVDPANVYGALLSWPESGAGEQQRPRRVAGAWVVLVAGRLVLYVGASGRQVMTFPAMLTEDRGELELAVEALHGLPRRGRRAPVIEKIDDRPARQSPHYELFCRAGYVDDYRGLTPLPEHAVSADARG